MQTYKPLSRIILSIVELHQNQLRSLKDLSEHTLEGLLFILFKEDALNTQLGLWPIA